jgi:hypothetical protein
MGGHRARRRGRRCHDGGAGIARGAPDPPFESVLEILENGSVGIDAALKGDVCDGYRGPQLNKQKINESKQYVKRTK